MSEGDDNKGANAEGDAEPEAESEAPTRRLPFSESLLPARRRSTPLGLGAVRPPSETEIKTPIAMPSPFAMRPPAPTLNDEDAHERAKQAVRSAPPPRKRLDSIDEVFGGLDTHAIAAGAKAGSGGDDLDPRSARSQLSVPPVGLRPDSIQPEVASDEPSPDRKLMRSRLAIGDFSGALDAARVVLVESPQDAEAESVIEVAEETLRSMFITRLGGLENVPARAADSARLRYASIDHRAGFVLSHVDGVSTIEMILDVSGMSQLDALRVLCELLDQRIIAVE